MKIFIKIEDYFENIANNLSYSDKNKILELRDDLNSCKTVLDQIEYIEAWRQYRKNRNLDSRCFGIDTNAQIDSNLLAKKENYTNLANEKWNGDENPDLEDLKKQWASKDDNSNLKSKLANNNWGTILKVTAVSSVVLLILNAGIYIFGIVNSIGSTPFTFCANGKSVSRTLLGYTKVKDGYKIPIDYMVAGEGYTGQNYGGGDKERGVGVFASEDFAWDGTDQFSYENYAVAARWEYVSYSVEEGKWPEHAAYGNGTSDGVDTSKPYTNLDSGQYQWVTKQKVLVYNPENNKAVIAMVGNGNNNPNWGGSPLNAIAGLSYKAQEALGFKVGDLDGGDYETNSRDSGVKLEMYWAAEDSVVGPVSGGLQVGLSTAECDPKSFSTGGNASIADAVVSYAYENQNEGRGNDGTPLYKFLMQSIFPGDTYYQSCDRGASTAIRWSGADDSFPSGSTEIQYEYLKNSSKWVEITEFGGKNTDVLKPGDVLITTGRGHIMIYTGNEAMKKKFPNSSYDLVSASIGERSPGAGSVKTTLKYDTRPYIAFRNIETEANSIYKNIKYN